MHNTTFLRLYILTKVKEIQEESDSPSIDVPRAFELQGKLELLKEIFEELHLQPKPEEKLKFHNQI